MSILNPVMSCVNGYYIIPGFSRYAMATDGSVINTESKETLNGYRGPLGYHKFTLISDTNNKIMVGRHRLLCIVFKNPGVDFTNLCVNHINNIPGDDRLENLEWVTHKQNVQHAASQGRMSRRKTKIQVKSIDTGEIKEFETKAECARKHGLTVDQIVYRLAHSQTRVYPERNQYRLHEDGDWPDPDDVDMELLNNGTTKSCKCFNAITLEEHLFDALGDMANFLNVKQSTVSVWLSQDEMRIHHGGWIVKYSQDMRPWRSDLKTREDVYRDYNKHNKLNQVVQVIDVRNKMIYYYWTAKDAADARGISVTALDYRLKTNGESVFSDGCQYGYFPY